MSILIKGMEMPKSCDECRITVFEDTNCVPELFCGCPIVFKAHPQGVGHRPDYCPLVPIPPHGDLIDRDALAKMCQEMQSVEWNNKAAPYSWAYAYESFESDIDNAPTVIEAEEGE